MAFDLIKEIQKKTREEWLQLPKDRYTEARIWIQEHSEKSCLISVIVGALVVLFFKFVFSLAALVAVCYVVLLLIAKPEAGAGNSNGGVGGSDSPASN